MFWEEENSISFHKDLDLVVARSNFSVSVIAVVCLERLCMMEEQ